MTVIAPANAITSAAAELFYAILCCIRVSSSAYIAAIILEFDVERKTCQGCVRSKVMETLIREYIYVCVCGSIYPRCCRDSILWYRVFAPI